MVLRSFFTRLMATGCCCAPGCAALCRPDVMLMCPHSSALIGIVQPRWPRSRLHADTPFVSLPRMHQRGSVECYWAISATLKQSAKFPRRREKRWDDVFEVFCVGIVGIECVTMCFFKALSQWECGKCHFKQKGSGCLRKDRTCRVLFFSRCARVYFRWQAGNNDYPRPGCL